MNLCFGSFHGPAAYLFNCLADPRQVGETGKLFDPIRNGPLGAFATLVSAEECGDDIMSPLARQ